jgi:hypothetical protein
MADAIKAQILNRVKELLDPLVQQEIVRKVERKTSILLLEPMTPAIHIVAGQEQVTEEDIYGYTMSFLLDLKVIFLQGSDPGPQSDELEKQVQQKIEADPQLNQLANEIKYDGNQPFINAENAPDGGTIVQYTITYRRKKGQPDLSY